MEDEDVKECVKEQDPISHDTVGIQQYRLHNHSKVRGSDVTLVS